MRTDLIQTKVRPIKKIFIIENNDYESFAKIFTEIQNEIDIIQNLLFINDDELWSQPNKDFVKRSDPDIILNLSYLDDETLSTHFGISSFRPTEPQFEIGRFGTNLSGFVKHPNFFNKLGIDKDKVFHVLSANKLENTAESLLACINYGLFSDDIKKSLGLSIFKNIQANYLTEKEDIINSIFEHDKKHIQLTTNIGGFAGSGYGSSIWEIDYNPQNIFNFRNKKYFFISEKNDFKTIAFFWNTRSYYPYANTAWIPIDFLNDIVALVDNETVFVCFDDNIEGKVKNQFSSNEIIQPSNLYFSGRNERWTYFEHTQTIAINSDEIIIQHPTEKSFCDMGLGGAFVLEMRGLNEFVYPKRKNIGNLFFPKNYPHELFRERFQRISELGLSKYILQFDPLKESDIIQSIVLPNFSQVIQHFFEDIGYSTKKTPKSSILEQTVNLLGGIKELNAISNQNVFDLLIALTPKQRTENAINKILKDLKETTITPNNILDIIAEFKEKGAVNFPSSILTIEEIIIKTDLKGNDKTEFFPVLQKLYNQKIFLRGKYFECPYCNSKLWIQIDEINRVNYCAECSNMIHLPLFLNDKQVSDYFRLNQLIVRSVDQGQLSTILLLNIFVQQKYRMFDFQSNLEVFKNNKLITDIDLLLKIGRRIGIAECKSTGGFSEKQINELIEIATIMQCDFIAFSSLIDCNSQELEDIVNILLAKNLEFPAFIFTREALFNPHSIAIQHCFEKHDSMSFKVGPIVISE